ncbi:unnamed protein product [Calypogeia fissa]
MAGQRRKISYHRELYIVRKRIARIMRGKGSGKKKGKRPAAVPVVDLSCCKYELLRIVLRKNGWEESGDDEKNCHLIWTDMSIGPERLMVLKRGQKINHFFGMLQICRKKSLALNLATMRKMFPSQYKFFPRSFILPNQLPGLLAKFNNHKIRTFILKPDNGCQGRGVALAQSGSDVRSAIEGLSGSNLLAQKYLANPMLINGYKFDLRIYVLILSCDPLRLYLYREGIVRFCTEKYSKPDPKNLSLNCMHLTNYAVNKHNGKFEFNTNADETDRGHKWTLTSLFSSLASSGHDTQKLHRQISQLVVMTIIAINPLLVHNYEAYLPEDESGRACFELLGMDVLLDEKCKPWLLEVNHSPSFSIDTPLDLTVKEALLTDTLRLVHMDPSGIMKLRMQEKKGALSRLYGRGQPGGESLANQTSVMRCVRKEDPFDEFEKGNRGKYDRIYPSEDKNLNELYRIFLAGAEAAFKHSFHMRIKDTIVRVREERRQEEQAKEAEEKRKVKARFEMRRKAQRSARLAALAARARLVEKLTARMQEEMQSLVPARGNSDPLTSTLHEKLQISPPIHLQLVAHPPPVAHPPTVAIQPIARPQLTEISNSHKTLKVSDDFYGVMKHWRYKPESRSCFPGPAASNRSSQVAGDALTSPRLTPKPKAFCSYRNPATSADIEMRNAFFTKPLKEINARELVTRSSFLKDHYDILKPPFAITGPIQPMRLKERSDSSSYALFQQYQRKLPVLSQNGSYSLRTNTLSLPSTTFSPLGSKYYVKSVPEFACEQEAAQAQALAQVKVRTQPAPTIADIMRAQFGLPKIGDHAKWKPSSNQVSLNRRTPGNDKNSLHMRARALFGQPIAHSALGKLAFPHSSEQKKVEKRKKASPHNINHLFRERKAVSYS